MKRLLVLLWVGAVVVCGGTPAAVAEDEEIDFQALAQLVQEMQKQIDQQDVQRATNAVKTFKDGAASDRAALSLFLDCKYLVDFKNKGKSYVDFRRWKQTELEKLKDSGAGEAFRVQLAWLVLLMEAGHSESQDVVVGKVLDFLENLAKDAKDLQEHTETLRESVLQSVFARAYEYDQRLKADALGAAPLDFEQHFEGLILPSAREHGLDAIKGAWAQRMALEEAIARAWSREGREGDFEKGRLPELQWSRDVDLARHGASAGKAVNALIKHLKKHIEHPKAQAWLTELIALSAEWERAAWDGESVEDEGRTEAGKSVARPTEAGTLRELVE